MSLYGVHTVQTQIFLGHPDATQRRPRSRRAASFVPTTWSMGLACLVSELVRVGLVQAEFVHLKRISTMSSPLVLAFDLSEMVAQVLFSAKTKGAEGIVVLRAALLCAVTWLSPLGAPGLTPRDPELHPSGS